MSLLARKQLGAKVTVADCGQPKIPMACCMKLDVTTSSTSKNMTCDDYPAWIEYLIALAEFREIRELSLYFMIENRPSLSEIRFETF
jgi:hypothetical protein|tara:strand:- start:4064 stop:4324 length:261 start_codon:yes stop_codon:yes gene_type:complete